MADPQPTPIAAAAQPAPGAGDDAAWAGLRRLTAARIGLRRSGASLAPGPMLDLRQALARARDAVHAPLDEERLRADLAALGLPVLAVASAVRDRPQCLMRPDLGRQLSSDSEAVLAEHAGNGHDEALVIADGLSARAVEPHARPPLAEVLPLLRADAWRVAPLSRGRKRRVALAGRVPKRLPR